MLPQDLGVVEADEDGTAAILLDDMEQSASRVMLSIAAIVVPVRYCTRGERPMLPVHQRRGGPRPNFVFSRSPVSALVLHSRRAA